MHVSLTPQLEDYVQQKIASGRYNNASEVLREALRVLIERDEEREAKLHALRREIQASIASGPAEPWEGAEEIKRLARAEWDAQRSQSRE